jgi:hypothetical protein
MDFVEVDRLIAQLMECKPLSEQEVKSLCEKVRKKKEKKDNHEKPTHFLLFSIMVGKRDPSGRIQCATSEVPGHSVRGYSWTVP